MSIADKVLLVIGYVWPEPDSSAAGKRMMDLLKIFQQQHYQITFASPAKDTDYMLDLKSQNITKISIAVNDSDFNSYIDELQPDVVLFDRFMMEEQFGWRVDECCPDALRLLDTEDLHCLRAARREANKQKRDVIADDYFSDKAKREIASIFRCDLSFMISHKEINLLTDFFKVESSLLHYIPFLVKPLTDNHKKQLPTFDERRHFISIGNFHHRPNWDAVLQLKNELWPHISKHLPNAKMFIYGAYMPAKAKQLHNEKQRFYVLGRAEEVGDVMQQAKVCLAPIRFGAGIKGKLLDAMIYGTPSVTTPIGAESMHNNLPWNGAICNNNQDFIDQAVKLYKSPSDWQQAQKNGFDILNQVYDIDTHTHALVERVAEISNNLKAHRQHNFIGAMLRHHQLKSTEYMSKWIEAKNSV